MDTTTATQALPLCVDLDGTLIRSDAFLEGLFALRPGRGLLRVARAALAGRAAFKAAVAAETRLDPALLPYNEALLAWLAEERAKGRRIVLATAADAAVAGAVAAHLGLFDEVIASDGARNNKGAAKAERLVARFGRRGFAYAGDSRADLPVWAAAGAAVTVDAPAALRAEVARLAPIERDFEDRRPPRPSAALAAMRPHQWSKNLLVFVPVLAAQAVADGASWLASALLFVGFSAMASGIYVFNDLSDLAADRAHPRKRARPFASGALSPLSGAALGGLLLALGAALAAAAGALWVVLLYAAISLAYSLRLKELPLVDVFVLAALYTVRLYGGGQATAHGVSLWLLGFSSFLFLGLAFLKRVGELTEAAATGREMSRRGYMAGDIQVLQMFGIAAAFSACVVLALFVQHEATHGRYAWPGALWGTIPLILFWQCRIWVSTARGYMHDDPIVYAARDWVSWCVFACLAAVVLLASAGPPRLL